MGQHRIYLVVLISGVTGMLSVLIPGAINVLLSPYLPFKFSIKSSADKVSNFFTFPFSYNSIIVGLSLALFCILLNSFSIHLVDLDIVVVKACNPSANKRPCLAEPADPFIALPHKSIVTERT